MDIGIYPKLTKQYILDRISQEEIMEKYLGVPVNKETLQGCSVKSPLRVDNSPTCNYWYNENGKLRFRDWSGHFHGDCFDVVAYRLGVGTSKKEFMLILHTIAKDFRIHKYTEYNEVINYNNKTKEFFNAKKKVKSIVIYKIIPRQIEIHDRRYWGRFNINENILRAYYVYFAQEIYMSKDGLPFVNIYRYNPKDPAYCYYGGKDNRNIDIWKIYFPMRKAKGEIGFLSNGSFLQGKHTLTTDRVCVINKSLKDVMALRSIGIQGVAPSTETSLITKQDYLFLKSRFDFIVSCMDYGIEGKLDRAGISMAKQLRDIYGITPIMFTNGMFGSKNYTGKDTSDYIQAKGPQTLINVIIDLHKQYESDFRTLDKYYYNSLKFINENY